MALPECKPDRYSDKGYTEAEVERWIKEYGYTKPPHQRVKCMQIARQHWKDFHPEKDQIHAYMIAPWVRPFIDIDLQDRPIKTKPLSREAMRKIADLEYERNMLFYKPLGCQILPDVQAINHKITEIRENR